VLTDIEEKSKLKVEWSKNEKKIDFAVETRYVFNEKDYSLLIKNCQVSDTSGYNCHANNGLDTAESDMAQVVVKGNYLILF